MESTDSQSAAIGEQLEASRTSAVLFPLEKYHVFSVHGPDAERYLQGRITQDIRSLGAGSLGVGAFALPSMVLSPQGKMLGSFLIYKVEDGYRIIAEPGSGDTAAEDFVRGLFMFKVADQLECEKLDSQSLFYLAGPYAGTNLPRASAEASGQQEDFAIGSIPLSSGLTLESLCDNRGELPAYIVSCPKEASEEFFRSLGDEVTSGSADGFNAYRIIQGIPEYGRDTTEKIVATEIPHEQAISFKKGCYAGQEVVEMSIARGRPNRQLVHLRSTGDKPFEPDTAILLADDEKRVGFISSSVVVPGTEECYSLGFLKTAVEADAPIVADGVPLSRLTSDRQSA